jgi:hypothetical protein
MPHTNDTGASAVTVDIAPMPARSLVITVTKQTPIVPERRRAWPLAPWRWVLLLTGLGLAITCGIPAADPVWNGADLAVLISLAIFVAAFTPGRD